MTEPQEQRGPAADPFLLLTDCLVRAEKIAAAVQKHATSLPLPDQFAVVAGDITLAVTGLERYLAACDALFAEPIKEAIADAQPASTQLFIPGSTARN